MLAQDSSLLPKGTTSLNNSVAIAKDQKQGNAFTIPFYLNLMN